MERKVTDESMLQWRNDVNQSVQDTADHGRIKFLSPEDPALGVRRMVARSTDLKPLAISFGDFNPWAGDWSTVVGNTEQERRFSAPTSAFWVTYQSIQPSDLPNLQTYVNLYASMVSYVGKIQQGVMYHTAVGEEFLLTVDDLFDESLTTAWDDVFDTSNNDENVGPWVPFPLMMDTIGSYLELQDMSFYQGDRARVKVSASPFGGDTHGQLAAVHSTLQAESTAGTNSAMPMHNYTEIATLPSLGSGIAHSTADGLGICDNVYAWSPDSDWTGGDAETSDADDKSIGAPDVAIQDMIDNGAAHTIAFPIFMNQAVSGFDHGIISFYQPHWTTGGDGHSARIVSAAGGYAAPNGFMSSGSIADLQVTSAGMPLALPDVDGSHNFWIDGAKLGHTGSYGIDDGDRPWHTVLVNVSPSNASHYRTTKTEGDGAFSFGMYGYGYNAAPLTPSDWPVVMYHVNTKLRHIIGSVYSIGNAVFSSGSEIGLETACFTQPYLSFQWEDIGGQGPNYAYDLDLKGYRYKFQNSNLSTPKSARMDCRAADGGYRPSPIYLCPFTRDKFKLWETKVDTYGVTTTTGRYDAMSANDAGLIETVGGALFTQRPDLTVNLYTHWTAETPTQVIGRFTAKVI